ncbi:choloylglycine hydrolase [Bifidobacterium choloepi]|uniref:choloylglycine hydrolase n=1 Tax=Bifidobacterium choloepi TaxID=2614131 RepID=A0A6I5NFL6_9BIFI|nr:choloylglycine hydrolase [Bifidobacterium choloepi]NEG69153.1 choloylglycine hydrolase family protein [Bifidobacterium choloepi]
MCTGVRFTDAEGDMYFGRNLDWECSYGETMKVTPRNFDYQPEFNATFGKRAVFGLAITAEDKPLYYDCANENGLAIAGLNFPGYAKYEDGPVDGKTNVAAYEFPLWVTRNFDSVDEVEAALDGVAIVAKPVNDKWPVALLHWIVADKTRSIVVEYMADGIHVYHNPIDAMTNQPTFAYHLENMKNYMNVTVDFPPTTDWDKYEMTAWGSGVSMHGLPGDYSSPSRLVRAAYTNSHYPQTSDEAHGVNRLFKTLQGSSMIYGGAKMENGNYEYTVYTSCFSTKTMTYYHTSYEDPTPKSWKLSDFDLDGTALISAA